MSLPQTPVHLTDQKRYSFAFKEHFSNEPSVLDRPSRSSFTVKCNSSDAGSEVVARVTFGLQFQRPEAEQSSKLHCIFVKVFPVSQACSSRQPV